MPKTSSQFVCQQCGYDTPRWMGQCPNCGTWNSLVEMRVSSKSSKFKHQSLKKIEPIRLSEVKSEDYSKRVPTGISELDRVLGGGIVSGMAVLVAGEPGIGKSTLLLQIADKIGNRPVGTGSVEKDYPSNHLAPSVVYIAGEESTNQIANRAARIGAKKGNNISILEETDVDEVISNLGNLSDLSLIIVDSIQTLTTADLTGTAGSIGQVRECAARLVSFAKKNQIPVFLVGHVTKDGTIAGPRVLEHMVDTVLWFEGDRREALRILRTVKNRFGTTDEVGIFSMEEKGLIEVINPSKMFVNESIGEVSGSAITAVVTGTRPILVEIQALVGKTKLAFPKRSASGVDSKRLELIIAVLSKRSGIPLWEYDVFVNVAGGIKIQEPTADLAMALAIASSFFDKPLPSGTASIGEVGLLGEIREVINQERCIKEAKRLGLTKIISSKQNSTVAEAIKKYLSE